MGGRIDFPISCRVVLIETPEWGPGHGVELGSQGTVRDWMGYDMVRVMFDHQHDPLPLCVFIHRLARIPEHVLFDVV